MKRFFPGIIGRSLSRFLPLALAFGVWAAPGAAAGRVPAVGGPSIRLDFSRPFIEEWSRTVPADIGKARLPRLEITRWADIAGEAAWENAALLAPLTGAEPKTEFRAFYGDGGLVFRARNSFEPGNLPKAASPDHFSWSEDLVEIRLRVPNSGPDAQNPDFHFAVSPAGAVYATRKGERFTPHLEARAEIAGDCWTVWILIPFSTLGLGRPVPEIEVNIGRDGPAMGHLSWGPDWPETAHRRIVLEGVAETPVPEPEPGFLSGTAPVHRGLRAGKGISLGWMTGTARPQDRWIEGEVRVDPAVLQSGDVVQISLFAPGQTEPLDIVRAVPERVTGRLGVDLRRWGLENARLEARLNRGDETIGLAESIIEARSLPPAPAPGLKIPLVVNLPEGPGPAGPWPLTAGIPFPAGMLWEKDGWVIEDGAGKRYPTQLEVTGLWALEGAVKWLRVDTVADPERELFLVYRPGEPAPVHAGPVRVERAGETILLSNGLVSCRLSAEGSPVREIHAGGRLVADTVDTRGLYLVDQAGRLAVASSEGAEILVEAEGPTAACVRIEGDYRVISGGTGAGEAVARHITRVELFAGQPFARVVHTLVLTRDTNETWFREAGWEFDLAPGASREALFAVSRNDPGAFHPAAGEDETYLLQESYFRFGAGEKKFILSEAGRETLSGGEMGDWFALHNDSAGLMISCRESARQHPKEFHVQGNRMNLKLFSARTGEELDFRTETLMQRWNLREWFTGFGVPFWIVPGQYTAAERVEKALATVSQINSNALGWAKTHEILLMAAPGRRDPREAAAASDRHSRPVFMLADPWWTYRSRAMGALYPRDPERFPEAERVVDETLSFWNSRLAESFGYYGFIDYNAGPTFQDEAGRKYPRPRRWNYTYTIRPDSWRVFARSGLREAFEFATGTCRAFADNHFASWDGPRTVKGLYTSRGGPDDFTGVFALPFYWGVGTNQVHYNHMTNNDQFAWDYHLTGWRRAADQLRDYASALRRRWTPGYRDAYRSTPLPVFRLLAQSYEFTRDTDFRELAYAAFEPVENPESAVGLHEVWPGHGSTYKTQVHLRDIMAGWEIFGDPRFLRVLRQVGAYWWEGQLGAEPLSYCSPKGILGQFFYDETGDPAIARELHIALRRACSRRDPSAAYPMSPGTWETTFIFEGIPAVLDVISRSGTDRRPVGSWAAVRDFGFPVEFYLKKEQEQKIILATAGPGEAVFGGSRLEMLSPTVGWAMMHASKIRAGGYGRWELPPDVPAGVFRFAPGKTGDHYALASGSRATPWLVLHAPSYWVPWPPQAPEVSWFFRVPENAGRPAIFLEGRARLFTPEGELWKEKEGLPEWVSLPPEKPGIWSFVPLDRQLVRVRNLPPFFAAETAASYFDPGVGWEDAGEEDGPEALPAETGFTAGLRDGRGLYISPRGKLALEGGRELEGGLGREFLPFQEGTVEFWMKPVSWDTFNMPGDPRAGQVVKPIVGMGTWYLQYSMNYADRRPHNNYAFQSFIRLINGQGQRWSSPTYRQNTIVEPGEWVHIAVTWGPVTRNWYGRVGTGMTFTTYVNGRRGTTASSNFPATIGYRPAAAPVNLVLYGGSVFNHLRVSDVSRYSGDFEPPAGPPAVDDRTRAYFSLDGTMAGVTGEGRTVEAATAP